MNIYKKKITTLLVSLCLICMSIVPVFAETTAAPDATVPAAGIVRNEAQLTASYLMANTDFTQISDTSTFYNASRNLLLSIRSGYNCSEQVNTYLNSVKALVNTDGTLNIENPSWAEPNNILSSYAYLLMVLAVTGNDASDFNGADIVTAFDKILGTLSVTDVSSANLNPYHIGTFYSAVYSYKSQLQNADSAIAIIKSGLLALCDSDNGVNYWGNSADNNGIVLPSFSSMYNSDENVKNKIDSASVYTKSLLNENGVIVMWDAPNSDSTALALAFYAQYCDSAVAALTYNGLINNFKSASNNGAFTFSGSDSLYSTQDAMIGLVTYLYALEEKSNPFDVTYEVKTIADAKNNPAEESPSDVPDEDSTEAATSASTDDNKTSAQTGDINIYLYILIACAGAASMISAVIRSKCRENV